jgi:uncharacterized metal-binding protein YceD (DUF177 family)
MSEFSRPVRVDTIGTEPREIAIEASGAELAALARRFDIASLGSLSARAHLSRQGGDIRATGSLEAELVQLCAATGVDLPSRIAEPFDVIFRAEVPSDVPEAGLELSEGECDVVFFDGAAADLGEAVAETLALAIDPFARAPGADAVLGAAGVLSEEEARAASSPFAGLAGLKT